MTEGSTSISIDETNSEVAVKLPVACGTAGFKRIAFIAGFMKNGVPGKEQ